MSTDHEHSPQKLVYLRDRAPRTKARNARAEREPPVAHPDLANEATWLGRLLLAAAGLITIHGLLVLSGTLDADGDSVASSAASQLVAHAYLAAMVAFAAHQLLRGRERAPVLVAFAASGLILVALEVLTHLVVSADLSRISLAARTDILARSGMLGLGVWAGSYALRAGRRPGAV
ncbi:MAG: hypothetical protein FJ148_05820 [Deltaproteobacteria bacterium]|nr:hypothetical protein [Deltaproteobacteria bacterium]